MMTNDHAKPEREAFLRPPKSGYTDLDLIFWAGLWGLFWFTVGALG